MLSLKEDVNSEGLEVMFHGVNIKFIDEGFLILGDDPLFSNVFIDLLTLTDDSLKWDFQRQSYVCAESGLQVQSKIYEDLRKLMYKWSRSHNPLYGVSHEVSSRGDKYYSAFWAYLPSGENIETVYQLDVKGYRVKSNDWKLGKGKPALNGKSIKELFDDYVGLWEQYFEFDHYALDKLKNKLETKNAGHLTDMFASTQVNQARAIALILNKSNYSKLKAGVGSS